MAIGIENFPDIDTSNPSEWPNGQIKDAAIGVTGTPANQLTNGDIFQTFDYLLRQQGVTASGDPEGDGFGHQYFDAMKGLFGGYLYDTHAAPDGDTITFDFSRHVLYTSPTVAATTINFNTSAIPDVPGNKAMLFMQTSIGHVLSFHVASGSLGTVQVLTGPGSLTSATNGTFVVEVEYWGIIGTSPAEPYYMVKVYNL